MKRYKSYIITAMCMTLALAFTACSDEYMDDMNTDPSKAEKIDPNSQLTLAELQTYGDLGMIEIYRSYIYAFTQQLMGCWNTTNYGGQHKIDNNEMNRFWTNLYTAGIKNLVDVETQTEGDENLVNIHSAAIIYKVYLMSIITDTYGDAPYSEAAKGWISGITSPRYDTQEEIYNSFFTELTNAVAALDEFKDEITGDVIFNGDVYKWKKLGNSLRMRYAMRISDVVPDKAKEEFEKAYTDPAGYMTSADDDALIEYMNLTFNFGQEAYTDYRRNALSQLFFGNDPANNQTYICSTLFDELNNNNDPRTFVLSRCYFDKGLTQSKPDNRIDLTDEMLSSNATFDPCQPGEFWYEPWPDDGYWSSIIESLKNRYPDNANYSNPWLQDPTRPKLAQNFLKSDNPGVVMTYAEVEFLLAEAKLKGWNVGDATVEQHYENGVKASMAFLVDNYDCEIDNQAINDYIANHSISALSDEGKKEAINTQAWILHFHNPSECWANVRRSGYPKLKSPAEYGYAADKLTGGYDIPVRLCYPILESSYNKEGYKEALDRMGGTNSWNIPVWWDKE
ncbi:SusD/RagB family nutrient-binding outer membrane lipoprotein [Bacteroides caecigallinarum]|uniref:SusD/RagB family nutrient-binding outer membrane lipoprotein n=1 Tax=Bacteroides caecigallinarum TaxID=1411144 RepID=UPI0019597B4F|nr:SusD/RagB family nutrient-binding outer membrane lipoprotein [Bacteroides caecigallinarum]MBM6866091.1 SusD/RagB family nutrient-binding outer membrane lipoprotein [Bacteroides caecigallinarum]